MNWKVKAGIQNAIASLPYLFSYFVYYWIQRHFGELRRIRPVSRLTAGIEVSKRIEKAGRSAIGGTFLEIGTGRRINMPVAFWLVGAEKIITVDLNPYLKEELIREDIGYMRENQEQVIQLFGGRIYDGRLDKLMELTDKKWRLVDLLELCNIKYLAPVDAANLSIPSESVDFHSSYTVFEHIPPKALKAILKEGNRIIKSGGIFIHRIDYSDHFSHSDNTISPINFLKFSEDKWDKIAGNMYMYMNRLRVDDFIELFQSSNHRILTNEPEVTPSVYELLREGDFTLNDRFAGKSEDVLATTGSWIVSEKCG
jgi:SAM-dependent methyltransferase